MLVFRVGALPVPLFFRLWTPASVEASGGINIVHAALLLLQWCRVAHAIPYSIGR